MQRKGQLTLFLILGLSIALLVAAAFLLAQNKAQKIPNDSSFNADLQTVIALRDICLKTKFDEATTKYGLGISPNYAITESKIQSYLKTEMPRCFTTNRFNNLRIRAGSFKSKVKITDDSIQVNARLPLTIQRDLKIEKLDEFSLTKVKGYSQIETCESIVKVASSDGSTLAFDENAVSDFKLYKEGEDIVLSFESADSEEYQFPLFKPDDTYVGLGGISEKLSFDESIPIAVGSNFILSSNGITSVWNMVQNSGNTIKIQNIATGDEKTFSGSISYSSQTYAISNGRIDFNSDSDFNDAIIKINSKNGQLTVLNDHDILPSPENGDGFKISPWLKTSNDVLMFNNLDKTHFRFYFVENSNGKVDFYGNDGSGIRFIMNEGQKIRIGDIFIISDGKNTQFLQLLRITDDFIEVQGVTESMGTFDRWGYDQFGSIEYKGNKFGFKVIGNEIQVDLNGDGKLNCEEKLDSNPRPMPDDSYLGDELTCATSGQFQAAIAQDGTYYIQCTILLTSNPNDFSFEQSYCESSSGRRRSLMLDWSRTPNKLIAVIGGLQLTDTISAYAYSKSKGQFIECLPKIRNN